jgi:hypothetical protein
MFICLPLIGSGVLYLLKRVHDSWRSWRIHGIGFILSVVFGLAVSSGLALIFSTIPTVFKLPAILLSCLTIGVKALAVVVHQPGVQAVSLQLSIAECSYESSTQVCRTHTIGDAVNGPKTRSESWSRPTCLHPT